MCKRNPKQSLKKSTFLEWIKEYVIGGRFGEMRYMSIETPQGRRRGQVEWVHVLLKSKSLRNIKKSWSQIAKAVVRRSNEFNTYAQAIFFFIP